MKMLLIVMIIPLLNDGEPSVNQEIRDKPHRSDESLKE